MMYAGYCHRGPLNKQYLAHDRARYEVVKRNPTQRFELAYDGMRETETPHQENIKVSSYEWNDAYENWDFVE